MSKEIKEIVKKTYTDVLTSGQSCCSPGCCSPGQDYTFGESYAAVEGYQKEADYGLGCGIPTEYAKIKEGDTVLDLGSGAGNDVFVARKLAGERGRVLGVDMTEAMVAKANENKQKLGFENVEFLLGEIEQLPVKDDSVDVVISNCVMNLVPDKKRAYAEVHRVLKTGGHFSISDIVLQGELPEGIRKAAEMYAGCVSGALVREDYMNAIKSAGFKNITINKERAIAMPDQILRQYASKEELEKFRTGENAIISIGVYAEK